MTTKKTSRRPAKKAAKPSGPKAAKPRPKAAKPRPKAAKPSGSKAAKPTGRRGRGKGGANKSDFIRSMPRAMTARAVVEAGAKKGMHFSDQLVYNVRAAARPEGAWRNGKRVGRPRKVASGPNVLLRDDPAGRFRQLVVTLGVAQSRELLDEVDAKLRDVVAG